MKNCKFTEEEICKIEFYNTGYAYFDESYELEDEVNQKLNKKASEAALTILKIDSHYKAVIFKNDKNKLFFTSLQGCTCKQFENDSNYACVHMFKLAQVLNILDKETGVLLQPQPEVENIFSEENYSEDLSCSSVVLPKKEPASTVGVGKHCRHCGAVMNYDDDICPSCKNSQEFKVNTYNISGETNFLNGCCAAIAIVVVILIMANVLI